jgi:hypothetical protein
MTHLARIRMCNLYIYVILINTYAIVNKLFPAYKRPQKHRTHKSSMHVCIYKQLQQQAFFN